MKFQLTKRRHSVTYIQHTSYDIIYKPIVMSLQQVTAFKTITMWHHTERFLKALLIIRNAWRIGKQWVALKFVLLFSTHNFKRISWERYLKQVNTKTTEERNHHHNHNITITTRRNFTNNHNINCHSNDNNKHQCITKLLGRLSLSCIHNSLRYTLVPVNSYMNVLPPFLLMLMWYKLLLNTFTGRHIYSNSP